MFMVLSFSTGAIGQPSEAEIEMRAKEVGRSLRCVVCQNQSIDESDAPLAMDMRELVRDRLRDGDSNTEVISYMRERYGDYVLLKPPVQRNTYILWLTPFILLLAGLGWFFVNSGRREDER
ncbi:cytochrome c-type biogenesis protein [Hellea balneolensis]|uniref:cytochrome c-type biogenesis protein n=1 Tax=Hellea balneolensis TaxID=287478 RepID=UPI001F180EC9|nr:cytochrome c-type biogenesis protein [Hellea balneolensis]